MFCYLHGHIQRLGILRSLSLTCDVRVTGKVFTNHCLPSNSKWFDPVDGSTGETSRMPAHLSAPLITLMERVCAPRTSPAEPDRGEASSSRLTRQRSTRTCCISGTSAPGQRSSSLRAAAVRSDPTAHARTRMHARDSASLSASRPLSGVLSLHPT